MIKVWKDLSLTGRIVIGVWILCIAALIVFFIVRNNKENKDEVNNNTNTPEVAQVYEPSIGTPLPPDVQSVSNGSNVTAQVENQGEIAGATTSEPFVVPAPTKTPEQIESEMTGTNSPKVAPNAGVDPNAPVPYKNDILKFSIIMPAGTQVLEKVDSVRFTSKTGALYFQVSTSIAGSENLQTIEGQLKNSPSATNITYGTINNNPALKFTATGFGQGTTFIANGKIYYLLGDSKYFTNFKI